MCGHWDLTPGIIAPGDDGAVVFEGEAVVPAGGNGDDVVQIGGHVALPVGIVTPRGDGAIGEQGKGMGQSGGDGGNVSEVGGGQAGGLNMTAPAHDGSDGYIRAGRKAGQLTGSIRAGGESDSGTNGKRLGIG